ICSSVKRLRFIPWSSQWARAYFKMDYFNGARSLVPLRREGLSNAGEMFFVPIVKVGDEQPQPSLGKTPTIRVKIVRHLAADAQMMDGSVALPATVHG
ncbi:hypothetical protein PY649_27785, partial [Rhizobium mayense]|nr:hypothetical protein [Rhizobium mayense]